MAGFLQKLFGGKKQPQPAAGVQPDESLDDLYEEFCRTFCHKPGVNFMQYLREKNATRMIAWLHPSTPCALPKSFIRLFVGTTRAGQNLWEKPGVTMAYNGNWTAGGGLPPQESQDALSVLAQMWEKPIKLYYTETEGGPTMVMMFHPHPDQGDEAKPTESETT